MRQLIAAISNPSYHPTAIRVALLVGSILFAVNHGEALLNGKMNRARWTSGLLTYCAPYMVNLYGQQQGNRKTKEQA